MLIQSATQLLTLSGGPQRGRALGTLGIIENGAVLIRDEKIVAVGKTDELRAAYPNEPTLDASGSVVMPGFEATYQQERFHPDFLARWASLSTIRFMDWMDTNGSPVDTWESRPRIDDATWTVRGAPLEIMIELCNRLGANPWFCMPHRADDDYVRRTGQLRLW